MSNEERNRYYQVDPSSPRNDLRDAVNIVERGDARSYIDGRKPKRRDDSELLGDLVQKVSEAFRAYTEFSRLNDEQFAAASRPIVAQVKAAYEDLVNSAGNGGFEVSKQKLEELVTRQSSVMNVRIARFMNVVKSVLDENELQSRFKGGLNQYGKHMRLSCLTGDMNAFEANLALMLEWILGKEQREAVDSTIEFGRERLKRFLEGEDPICPYMVPGTSYVFFVYREGKEIGMLFRKQKGPLKAD